MDKWQRRTVYYSVALVGIMLVYAVLYHHGMRVFEGESRTFLHSLQVVVETFTTTGFGSDAPWETAEMNALVILMSVELMLNAANINLVAFSQFWGNVTGQTFGLFTMALAAAEVAVGIGIILVLYRNFKDVDVTVPKTMRW